MIGNRKVGVSGANGLVGKALTAFLTGRGDMPIPLVRGQNWDPESGRLELPELPEAIVHLAGESIASGRWTESRKRVIRSSRVEATERLVLSLLKLQQRPGVFVGASAIGYYGNRGDEVLTEAADPGEDFLARVATDWEAAAAPLASAGVRVVHLRFGMILSRDGGALARMLPLFKAGLGGKLGNGKQWVSWVGLQDVVRVIDWALENPAARGAYNVVAPQPTTNAEFTRVLAEAVHRPAIVLAPALLLRLAVGELADALLLSSQRVIPKRLLAEGFQFRVSELREALRP